jgi:hypothetical protein
MYKKVVQTSHLWAFAYELAAGGYALSVVYAGNQAVLHDEAEFDSLTALKVAMQEIAPLTQWSEKLFAKIMGHSSPYALSTQ